MNVAKCSKPLLQGANGDIENMTLVSDVQFRCIDPLK